MTHSLKITDGTTTATLTDGINYRLLAEGFTPRTPDITLQEAYSAILDGGEITEATFRNVTESALIEVIASTGAGVQFDLNEIERLFRQAERHQQNDRATAVYVHVQMDSDTAAWRSEILSGKVDLMDNVWGEWSNNKAEVLVTWTRRFYWETAAEAELELDSVLDARQIGGVAITNNNQGGNDSNWVDILASDVDGVLPVPGRMVIFNRSGSAINYRNIYIGQNVDSTPASFSHIIEAEDNETVGGTNTGTETGTHDGINGASSLTDSGASWTVNAFIGRKVYNVTDGSSATVTSNTATTISGTLTGGTQNDWDTGETYIIGTATHSGGLWHSKTWGSSTTHSTVLYTWTLSGTQLEYADGGFFRILAAFATSPNITCYVKASLRYTQIVMTETEEVQMNANLQLKDLGVLQIPPIGSGLSTLADMQLVLTARDSAAGSLSLDYIQLTPLDGWRHLKLLGGNWANNTQFVDDGMTNEMYVDESGTDILPFMVPGSGEKLLLVPDKNQRLYILFDEASDYNIDRVNDVRIYYRPRRLTI